MANFSAALPTRHRLPSADAVTSTKRKRSGSTHMPSKRNPDDGISSWTKEVTRGDGWTLSVWSDPETGRTAQAEYGPVSPSSTQYTHDAQNNTNLQASLNVQASCDDQKAQDLIKDELDVKDEWNIKGEWGFDENDFNAKNEFGIKDEFNTGEEFVSDEFDYPSEFDDSLWTCDLVGGHRQGVPALAEASPEVHVNVESVAGYGGPLDRDQQTVVDQIIQGRNVFFTGSAGCGKSTVLKTVVRKLAAVGKKVQVVAPTGKAAFVVNGMTTWSFMGWQPLHLQLPRQKLDRRAFADTTWSRLTAIDVLIIDEISMVESHHLERMDRSMKAVREWAAYQEGCAQPFGGVQLVVSGDFCQLPPVKPFEYCPECGQATERDYDDMYNCPDDHGPWHDDDKWAFRSPVWEECKFVHVNLTKVHRQSDVVFVSMLQKMRLGEALSPPEVDLLMDHPCKLDNVTRLFPTREEVKKTNDAKFWQMKTPVHTYKAQDDWRVEIEHIEDHWKAESPDVAEAVPDRFTSRFLDGTLEKLARHRFERQADLRGGMLVLLLTNLDTWGGLVNGSTGIICGFEDYDPEKLPRAAGAAGAPSGVDVIYGDHAKLMEASVKKFAEAHSTTKGQLKWPRVRFLDTDKTRVIYPHCSVSLEMLSKKRRVLSHRTQLPLMAGWAITIHKCQGMTLSRVVVNLAHAFENEQVYVALSRAKSLDGLKITGGRSVLEQAGGLNRAVRQFLVNTFGDQSLSYKG